MIPLFICGWDRSCCSMDHSCRIDFFCAELFFFYCLVHSQMISILDALSLLISLVCLAGINSLLGLFYNMTSHANNGNSSIFSFLYLVCDQRSLCNNTSEIQEEKGKGWAISLFPLFLSLLFTNRHLQSRWENHKIHQTQMTMSLLLLLLIKRHHPLIRITISSSNSSKMVPARLINHLHSIQTTANSTITTHLHIHRI